MDGWPFKHVIESGLWPLQHHEAVYDYRVCLCPAEAKRNKGFLIASELGSKIMFRRSCSCLGRRHKVMVCLEMAVLCFML